MRTLIGFNTASKIKSQEEINSQDTLPSEGQSIELDSERLKDETILRLRFLANIICGTEFQNYEPQQKQQMLSDFAYYSKVIDTVM